MRVLVVTNPFGGHQAGDTITDSIDEILAGEHSGHVVVTDRPDPEPRKPGRPPQTQEK